MPTTWNYVFAALPDHYSSAEVERRIRDEYGVHTSQSTSTSTAFQASYPNKTKDGCSRTPVPGQPYCTNCRVSGHRTEECYSKGGPMHGKRRDKKVNKEDKGDMKQEDKLKKGKGKDRSKTKTSKKANQAVADEEEDDEDNRRSDLDLSAYLTGTSPRSQFGWILDGSSTNHICTERSAFTTFAPTHDSIKGIVKNGPELELSLYLSQSRADQIVLLNYSMLATAPTLVTTSCRRAEWIGREWKSPNEMAGLPLKSQMAKPLWKDDYEGTYTKSIVL